MSTNDVPGANPVNGDKLRTGCWGEHADGSLVLVLSTEDDNVYYDLFDMSKAPILTYRDAMPIGDFMLEYSYDDSKLPAALKSRKRKLKAEKWTWHDKTPFPMSRVVAAGAQNGPQPPSAHDFLSAADRIRASLHLRAKKFDPGSYKHQAGETVQGPTIAFVIGDKMRRAFNELWR